jgi:hypothetical protein
VAPEGYCEIPCPALCQPLSWACHTYEHLLDPPLCPWCSFSLTSSSEMIYGGTGSHLPKATWLANVQAWSPVCLTVTLSSAMLTCSSH